MSALLKPLELSKWIDIDKNFVEVLNLKTQLLKKNYSEVFAALPGSEAGQQEILDLLLHHLLNHFPQYYQQKGTIVENFKTGQVWKPEEFKNAPLVLALQLVQEDIFLLQSFSQGYILSAGAACFPFFWRLPEKLGLHLSQIHEPVPEYAEKLLVPVNLYFENLKPDSPGSRIAWGIVPTPQLVLASWQSQPKSGWHRTITVENAGECLWLRTEYQTFRRLPKSGGIVFTIRTFVNPLSCLKEQPSIGRNLAIVIRQSPKTLTYKGIQPFLEVLVNYLA